MNKRNHERAEGQVSLSISLSEPLKQRVAAAAKSENRSLSNWFCTHVEKLLEDTSSLILLNETRIKPLQQDGQFTPAKHRGKYQTAAAKKAAERAGAKITKLSENLGSGSSTVTTDHSLKTGSQK
jgi:hypothetical protein